MSQLKSQRWVVQQSNTCQSSCIAYFAKFSCCFDCCIKIFPRYHFCQSNVGFAFLLLPECNQESTKLTQALCHNIEFLVPYLIHDACVLSVYQSTNNTILIICQVNSYRHMRICSQGKHHVRLLQTTALSHFCEQVRFLFTPRIWLHRNLKLSK